MTSADSRDDAVANFVCMPSTSFASDFSISPVALAWRRVHPRRQTCRPSRERYHHASPPLRHAVIVLFEHDGAAVADGVVVTGELPAASFRHSALSLPLGLYRRWAFSAAQEECDAPPAGKWGRG
jgi:hypothetical protein